MLKEERSKERKKKIERCELLMLGLMIMKEKFVKEWRFYIWLRIIWK